MGTAFGYIIGGILGIYLSRRSRAKKEVQRRTAIKLSHWGE